MTKDVLVSISGAHMVNGESDDVSVITAGTYYLKNGKHYILYDELIEGVEEAVRNTIKVGDNTVEIIKNGSVRSHMIFEQEKTNICCYAMPFGQMMVGVNTDDIVIEESPDRLLVEIEYSLEVNYETVSQCHIMIDIRSKAKADFRLGE